VLKDIIPESFKDKPWVSELKDIDGLFNKVDFLQSKIGERPAGIPQENAPKEDWEKFNKAWGVPEKPDDYKFDALPEGVPVDENFQKEIKGVLHKAGVNPRQAKILEKGYNELLVKSMEGLKGKQVELDKGFNELADKTFGADRDKALKVSRALLARYTPEEMKPYLGSLSNEQLVIMAATLTGIQKEFIDEDKLPTGGENVGPQSQSEKRELAKQLMASDAYTNPWHPEHEATKKKVDSLYGNA
jgi:hypothetical protein